ncbi:RING-H2 finger protein ATL80 [Artemisia annua]|uniref:RING-H2 finger protein ATL80 n=1 Tax=Artemisia annua TaxID=35608 RepID=A0A2U1LG04_ARTAN|nr:RING-H2 finger protein ATL80 [Artemisia annua]
MSRFLLTTQPPLSPPVDPITDGIKTIIIIAAAILCSLLLAAVAWLLRTHNAPLPLVPAPTNRVLKNKILKRLPKQTYSVSKSESGSDCAICISEYEEGDEIQVLPTCKHVFHVTCIDMWFRSHSSYPSCRQILTTRPMHDPVHGFNLFNTWTHNSHYSCV